MSDRIPICLVVGDNTQVDSFPRRYFENIDEVLTMCRKYAKKFARLHTSSSTVVVAFQHLHRLGEVELHLQRVRDGEVQNYEFDVKGEFIIPWPDEFFELEFHLRFGGYEEHDKARDRAKNQVRSGSVSEGNAPDHVGDAQSVYGSTDNDGSER